VEGFDTVVLPKSMVNAKEFLSTGSLGPSSLAMATPQQTKHGPKRLMSPTRFSLIGTARELVDELVR
jgi:hypothetical protein